MLPLEILFGIVGLGAVGFALSARVIKQIERGVVFRLGRAQTPVRPPGLTMLIPFVDRLRRSTCRS